MTKLGPILVRELSPSSPIASSNNSPWKVERLRQPSIMVLKMIGQGFAPAMARTIQRLVRRTPCGGNRICIVLTRLWILATTLGAASAMADYKDDIGYTRLQLELGAALPNGSGVGVSQNEAPLNS